MLEIKKEKEIEESNRKFKTINQQKNDKNKKVVYLDQNLIILKQEIESFLELMIQSKYGVGKEEIQDGHTKIVRKYTQLK
jgi:hypothetical protein